MREGSQRRRRLERRARPPQPPHDPERLPIGWALLAMILASTVLWILIGLGAAWLAARLTH